MNLLKLWTWKSRATGWGSTALWFSSAFGASGGRHDVVDINGLVDGVAVMVAVRQGSELLCTRNVA